MYAVLRLFFCCVLDLPAEAEAVPDLGADDVAPMGRFLPFEPLEDKRMLSLRLLFEAVRVEEDETPLEMLFEECLLLPFPFEFLLLLVALDSNCPLCRAAVCRSFSAAACAWICLIETIEIVQPTLYSFVRLPYVIATVVVFWQLSL